MPPRSANPISSKRKDENDVVVHSELVPEIAQEPSYDAALAALKG